jgi:Protein of unknown function (DUF507)
MLQEAARSVNARAAETLLPQLGGLATRRAFPRCRDSVSCTLLRQPVNCLFHCITGDAQSMLLNRDFVGHMASEVVKKLVEGNLIETKAAEALTQRLRMAMLEELGVEDRINEEARQILIQHQDEMRRTGASYQEMFKKVKAQLARDRKLILR